MKSARLWWLALGRIEVPIEIAPKLAPVVSGQFE